ncbi:MAG: DNA polymerase III subunit delta [Kiloniellales bacterium]|nr:DNA polymerase III subunit delta [Kiloniellales bacterium]
MKVTPAKADAFARRPDPAARVVLVYGPDEGLVRERAETLARSVVEDLSDPFRIGELSGPAVAQEPARLYDEAAAQALTGGRRVLRIRPAGDELAPIMKEFLAAPPGDSLVVLQAGDLPGRSALRKVIEASPAGAALPCYRDDPGSLAGLLGSLLAEQGLSASSEAMAYLGASLGADRQLTRREIEKLGLFKGPNGGEITLDEAVASVGDSAFLTLEDLAFAVGEGDRALVERSVQRGQDEGLNGVAMLRSVARHLQRLHLASGAIAAGTPGDQALARLRPPVFWKQKARFLDQCRRWTPARLARALEQLVETERRCKTSGAPAELLARRTLLELAAKAPRARN